MLAFHGKIAIKRRYLARVSAHQKADQLIKGRYWEDGKGCAVGCTIHSNDHSAYETELGIPSVLARLEDGIFEKLPNDLAQTWPKRFLQAIKPGADLTNVWAKFAVWLLTDETQGVLQFAETDAQRAAIQSVSDLYVLQSIGANIDPQDWMEAANANVAANSYANVAAYASAANASAANAAYAAYASAAYAYAAYASAAYAAYASAANASAANAAYAASASAPSARIAQSEKLLELLKEAR